MVPPLSPLSAADLNLKTPPSTRNQDQRSIDRRLKDADETPSRTKKHAEDRFDASDQDDHDGPPSSPFISDLAQRKSLSPSKNPGPAKHSSPTKREPLPSHQSSAAADRKLRENEGLTRAMDWMDADDSVIHHDVGDGNRTTATVGDESEYAGMDDTAFSTFSAIPNTDMTAFAKLGQNREHEAVATPSKASPRRPEVLSPNRREDLRTPRRRERHGFDDFDSPTPRRQRAAEEDNDTSNLILDFTEQFDALAGSSTSYSHLSTHRVNQSPGRGQNRPDLTSFARGARTPSPAKRPLPAATPTERKTLLDFEITPAPTPRSLPTITARELESLKSDYLSQISSLKAGLSGKEAEVNSLKGAVGDAEKRVGEAQEEVRAQRGAREALEGEREEWTRRNKDMESVLRGVKEEIIRREKEQDGLAERLDESERKRSEAEMKAAEAEGRLRAMRTDPATPSSRPQAGAANSAEVDAAIEQVAMDLHASYKKKHENKVAALKRSYEKRWEKRVKELEVKVDELNRENDELKVGKDLTMSGVVPGILDPAKSEAQAQTQAEDARKVQEHKARALGLMEEVASVKRDNERLIEELEKERVEKGDMVAAVEEMLSLQAGAGSVSEESTASGIENLRGSISRASGMRPPGYSSGTGVGGGGESRIGRIPVAGGQIRSRSGSGGVGVPRSTGIMGNIERMGRGRGD